jgi:hypothetical protein
MASRSVDQRKRGITAHLIAVIAPEPPIQKSKQGNPEEG